MAATFRILQSAQPRITYLDMDETVHGGFRTSYRADVQHAHRATAHTHAGPLQAVELLELTLHPHIEPSEYNVADDDDVRERWDVASYQLPRTIRVFRALEKHYGDSTTPKMINWQIPIVSGPYIPARVQRGYDIVEVRMHYWRNGVEVPTEDWWEMNLFVPFDEPMLPTEFTFHRWDGLAPTANNPHPNKVSVRLSRAAGQ
ncbi:hypothetical protein IWX90DRAFT_413564 [Phyllosticta citrichinensis]|uniref:Uncharacterized protein n=1 Tax=Phyllosticta citrichinensis TaxID=1130410 RepID=A0ABR1Y1G1_9PEZI